MDHKMASAYKIKEKIFIQSYAKTTDGLSRLDGPVFISEEADFIQLGNNILKAIEDAGQIIPHRVDWKEMQKEDKMLQEAKMKTWNALMKASQVVEIEEKGSSIELLPLRFKGTTGKNRGYDFLTEKAITCTDLSPETLGKSLIQAFELCE